MSTRTAHIERATGETRITLKLKIDGKEIDGDDHFRFVRLGEEYEDIEIRGYGFDIHPTRSIEY